MAGLGIRLDSGDKLIVNGAAIHFSTSAQIRIMNRARFLFGRQIMGPDQAVTPARRIYFALQTAYAGLPEEHGPALEEARYYATHFAQVTTSSSARLLLASAMEAAERGDGYRALLIARRIIRHEDAVFSLAESAPDGA